MTFLKDDSALLTIDLVAEQVVQAGPRAPEQVIAAAHVYNRLGSLLTRLCGEHGVDSACVIAVWLAQTGGRIFTHRRAQLRFEVEKFFEAWGHHNRQQFENHFRFGSHNLQPGQGWENQVYREDHAASFHGVHHNQNSEYAVLTMARTLAGEGPALTAACVGGCLLNMAEFAWVGYQSSVEMFDAFQESERSHVLGFFDYCSAKGAPKSGDLIRYLKVRDWDAFGRYYPALKQAPIDPERLQNGFSAVKLVMR